MEKVFNRPFGERFSLYFRNKDGKTFDYEENVNGNRFDVTIEVDEQGIGNTPDVSFTETVFIYNLNEAPTDILFDNLSIDENNIGGVISNLSVVDEDHNETFTYLQVYTKEKNGNGFIPDNRFEITNNQLKLKAGQALDFENESEITFYLTVRDSGNRSYFEEITIGVNDVNESPTNITLDNESVNENATGAVIGNLDTSDVDNEDTFTYTLDDDRFEVVNGQLKLKSGEFLNFENESSVNINITAEDSETLTYSQPFTITVNDVNETPTSGIINIKQRNNDISNKSTLYLGKINVNSGMVSQILTIKNIGNADLNITNMAISGANASDFKITSPTINTLSAGSTTTITIEFKPGGIQSRMATLIINSDDQDESTYSINLIGQGMTNRNIVATDKDDQINNLGGNIKIDAGAGNDTVSGGQKGELIRSGEGDDWVNSGRGNDRIYGDEGNDHILGGIGRDYLRGGDDNDSLFGNEGNDYLIGDSGDDYLDGGEGSDRLRGGTGNDTFVLSKAQGTDLILDFNPEEDQFELQDLQVSDLSFDTDRMFGLIKVDNKIIAKVRNISGEQLRLYFGV